MDLNVKDVLAAFSFRLHFTKAYRGPFLFQPVPPFDHLHASGALVVGAQTAVGGALPGVTGGLNRGG